MQQWIVLIFAVRKRFLDFKSTHLGRDFKKKFNKSPCFYGLGYTYKGFFKKKTLKHEICL